MIFELGNSSQKTIVAFAIFCGCLVAIKCISDITIFNLTTLNSTLQNYNLNGVWNETKPNKHILFYTTFFGMDDFMFGFGRQPFVDYKCPVTNCFTTNNKTLLGSVDKFDAVIFHTRDINPDLFPGEDLLQRRPSQRYILYQLESPLNDAFPYQRFRNFFNWTMTYRWDSDFVQPYGWIQPRAIKDSHPQTANQSYSLDYPQGNALLIKSISNMMRKNKKTKDTTISWMVSNCYTHSERNEFVQQLQQFVKVDIYGHCGQFQCPKSNVSQCLKMLEVKYKFYLSFENSLCEDYVTEKFFNILNYNLVPIVLGGANYSKFAPVKSFIDVRDFKSIAHLAEYIKYLDQNETAYSEYFEWKNYFSVVDEDVKKGFCHLCQALNDPYAATETFDDIDHWWVTLGRCIKRGRFPWSNDPQELPIKFFREN